MELYDLESDTMEVDNRAVEEPERAAALFERLEAWRAALPAGPVDPTAGSKAWRWPESSDSGLQPKP
jgi:hypothetical protein